MSLVYYNQEQCLTYGQMNLINDFRAIWTDVVLYLRGYILSSVGGLDKLAEATSRRLYNIAQQFESKLEPFFGPEVSEKFQQLLFEFLMDAKKVIDAFLINDEKGIDDTLAVLYQSIGEISDFMASINSYWNSEQWSNLLTRLVENGVTELTALREEDYDQFIQQAENSFRYTYSIGDYMANGIMYYLQPAKPSL